MTFSRPFLFSPGRKTGASLLFLCSWVWVIQFIGFTENLCDMTGISDELVEILDELTLLADRVFVFIDGYSVFFGVSGRLFSWRREFVA